MEETEYEHEPNPNSTLLNLPLFSIMPSPEHSSGMLTPPLSTSASVPFRWEEQPGKPRPCTSLIPFPSTTIQEPKGLELPPSRLFLEHPTNTKTPSPTTVLEGPYLLGTKSKFTASFRFSKERQRQSSFDSIDDDDDSQTSSPPDLETGQVSKSRLLHKGKGGIFGSWRYNIRTPKANKPVKMREIGGSSRSFVPPDFGSDESNISRKKVSRMRRNGSFSSSLSQARSHFWAAVYEGIKQVMPWKSRKSKKGLVQL